ncbi:MAG: hypothetical protein ACRCT7_08760 [Shewanella sp.]
MSQNDKMNADVDGLSASEAMVHYRCFTPASNGINGAAWQNSRHILWC